MSLYRVVNKRRIWCFRVLQVPITLQKPVILGDSMLPKPQTPEDTNIGQHSTCETFHAPLYFSCLGSWCYKACTPRPIWNIKQVLKSATTQSNTFFFNCLLPITLQSKSCQVENQSNSNTMGELLCNHMPREEKGKFFPLPMKPWHKAADFIWISFSMLQVTQLSSLLLCETTVFLPKGKKWAVGTFCYRKKKKI